MLTLHVLLVRFLLNLLLLSEFSHFSSCPTLRNPIRPDPSVHGIFSARILEWVAMPSSRGSSQPRHLTHVSCNSCLAGRFFICWVISGGGGGLVSKSCQTLETLWTVACQAPLSVRFPSQEYWSGLPFPSPGDMLNHKGSPNLLLPIAYIFIKSY